MNLLKNKHIVLAMLIAPVLAIIAYFATDSIVSEKPHQAKSGEQYKLAARSNCRYQSGRCSLHNGDVEIDIIIERLDDPYVEVTLLSNTPLQQALASLVIDQADAPPVSLVSAPDMMTWHARFESYEPEKAEMRLVVMLSGTTFYASIPTVFVDYETIFPRDNFTPENISR